MSYRFRLFPPSSGSDFYFIAVLAARIVDAWNCSYIRYTKDSLPSAEILYQHRPHIILWEKHLRDREREGRQTVFKLLIKDLLSREH